MNIDVHKQYTPEEAEALGIKIDMFGYPILDKARDMRDIFIVPPFSVIDTTDGNWQKRKKRWDSLINDTGQSREGTLMGTGGKRPVIQKIQEFNNGVSILDAVLAEVLCKWFGKEGFHVHDPFAGDAVFGYVSSYLDMIFNGIELRAEQAELNNLRLQGAGFTKSIYYNDTSENMDAYIADNSQDMIFSCPPYMDLEVYSDDPKDLSTMEPQQFFEVFSRVLANTYKKLKENRFAVIVISEVRCKKTGFYQKLVPKTIEIMEHAGYRYYNEVILINSVGTLPLRAGRFMSTTRKVGRRHQNVLVFYKGSNPGKDIKKVFPELAPPNEYYQQNDK